MMMAGYYQCERCTACCKWPGDVNITDDEVGTIAAYLDMSQDEFISQHTRLNKNRTGLSILERPNHECIMLVDGGCKIHAVKPEQCKGFPNRWNFPNWQEVCHATWQEGEMDS